MLPCLVRRNLQFAIRWESQRLFSANRVLHANKQHANLAKQGKIITKLFGRRTAGSKKRWMPSNNVTLSVSNGALTAASDIGKSARRNGKDVSRRVKILNKLFMGHITDLLATGEVSEQIVGKGLQISRTKVSQDFTHINVYWLSSGDMKKDIELEAHLKQCSGPLRHQLSQLDLMGKVPRIQFVKDKAQINIQQIETVLKNLNFGNDDSQDEQSAEEYSNELELAQFLGSEISAIPTDENDDMEIPKMRHDIFGLDHSAIMGRILAKMRKSQDAWNAYEKHTETDINQLEKVKENSKNECFTFDKENDTKLRAFVAEYTRDKSYRRNAVREESIYFDAESFSEEEDTVIISPEQKKLYDAEDYLDEDAINIDHTYEEEENHLK